MLAWTMIAARSCRCLLRLKNLKQIFKILFKTDIFRVTIFLKAKIGTSDEKFLLYEIFWPIQLLCC